jgi:hypothetical protein
MASPECRGRRRNAKSIVNVCAPSAFHMTEPSCFPVAWRPFPSSHRMKSCESIRENGCILGSILADSRFMCIRRYNNPLQSHSSHPWDPMGIQGSWVPSPPQRKSLDPMEFGHMHPSAGGMHESMLGDPAGQQSGEMHPDMPRYATWIPHTPRNFHGFSNLPLSTKITQMPQNKDAVLVPMAQNVCSLTAWRLPET